MLPFVIMAGLLLGACNDDKPTLDETAARLDEPEVEAAATSAAEAQSDDGTGNDSAEQPTEEDPDAGSAVPFDPTTGRPEPGSETTITGPDGIIQGTGVTDTEIHVAYIGDDSATIDAHYAYWEAVNAAGGVAGRNVMTIRSAPPDEPAAYEDMLAGVNASGDAPLMLGGIAGELGVARIADDLVAADLLAIPFSGWSGWVEPERSKNILEVQASDCAQAINTFSYLAEREGDTVAIASAPGQPYADSVAGAQFAAKADDMNVIAGGAGLLGSDADPDDVAAFILRLVEEDVDAVWLAADPAATEAFIQAAVAGGYREHFGGLMHTVSAATITGPSADVFDNKFLVGANYAVWGSNQEQGMQDMTGAIGRANPDAQITNGYEMGWIQAAAVHSLLEAAAAQGALTRRVMVDIATQTRVDFGGIAPSQSWSDDPAATAVRSSYAYEVNGDAFTAGPTTSDPEAPVLFRVRKTAVVSPAGSEWTPEACSPINP